MLSLNITMIGSPIHLIARLLIGLLHVCIVKWNTVLRHFWKSFQMAIYEHYNSCVKTLIFVVALR